MRRLGLWICGLALGLSTALAAAPERNPVVSRTISLGQQTHRLIVGFRATAANRIEQVVPTHRPGGTVRVVQAQTSAADVDALVARTGLPLQKSRQMTPSMHVLFLQREFYGAEVETALAQLRADPAVQFAAVDGRRYPLAAPAPVTPNDPLFQPTPAGNPPATGQWYLGAPNPTVTVEGVATQDLSATNAVAAWGITTGSTGVVIADVDTGVNFDHPDLLRAGQGGRLLPGYDFVGQDYDATSGKALGTFLTANDGDGWDPDPSDPGDWIAQSDIGSFFTTTNCGDPSQSGGLIGSSWHGTRVMGVLGALTNNSLGVAGMNWNSWLLPVRALGKCGGYDSDIITGIQWATGMAVTGVPANPYPADIVNLSLGGDTTACSASAYQTPLQGVTAMGVLVVIAAGNSSGATENPGNCGASVANGGVAGVIAVAGLRNVGTKVGYSSAGPEVGIAAPAGNCINSTGNCLRSIDTTVNEGTTVPTTSGYTNEVNANLGTSFATPIVAGVASLMRSVNGNLTPAQLVARLESSSTAFPTPPQGTTTICPTADPNTGECYCPQPSAGTPGQCGAGMVNALAAVQAAQAPIAAVMISGTTVNASASAAGCNPTSSGGTPLTVASYAWSATPAPLIPAGSTGSSVPVNTAAGAGTIMLVITDSQGGTDTATIAVSAGGVITSTAPTAGGSSANACPKPLAVTIAPPTVSQAFSPASVAPNTLSTLTITLANTNGFDLTQAAFTDTLPTGLAVPSTSQVSISCAVTASATTPNPNSPSYTATTLSAPNIIIPASGSCAITVPVQATTAGTYTSSVAAGALTTAPAGANTVPSTASLSVVTPASSGHGGGSLGWPDLLLGLSALILARGRAWRGAAKAARDSRRG
jgi:serine protease